jgi:hypothetical protein
MMAPTTCWAAGVSGRYGVLVGTLVDRQSNQVHQTESEFVRTNQSVYIKYRRYRKIMQHIAQARW